MTTISNGEIELAKTIYAQKCAIHRGAVSDRDALRSLAEAKTFYDTLEKQNGSDSRSS